MSYSSISACLLLCFYQYAVLTPHIFAHGCSFHWSFVENSDQSNLHSHPDSLYCKVCTTGLTVYTIFHSLCRFQPSILHYCFQPSSCILGMIIAHDRRRFWVQSPANSRCQFFHLKAFVIHSPSCSLILDIGSMFAKSIYYVFAAKIFYVDKVGVPCQFMVVLHCLIIIYSY